MDACSGTVTVEYYDGSSDFTETDESDYPTPTEQTPSCSPCSSSSVQNIRDSISCKIYDFKHVGSENGDYNESEQGGQMDPPNIFSEMAREAMQSHYLITHQENKQSLISPRASVLRCPRGDVPEQYSRRKHPGPFLTCSFSHSHECGDEFSRIQIPTKPVPEYDLFTRPQHLKEKKAKFFKPCKNCETIGFSHHRNPAKHYEDYLNNVTYKQHNNHAKVWQQHVVDLMYMLGEDLSYSEQISEECKHYKPSEIIVRASKRSRNTPRRIPTVVTRKRTPIIRPLRRPQPKKNASKVPYHVSSARANQQKENTLPKEENNTINSKTFSHQETSRSSRPKSRRAISGNKSQEMHYVQPIQRRSVSNDIDDINGRIKSNTLQKKLKSSITRLIKPRQASSNISKRFVKKPEQSKELKYIQKGKPNVSAKFLRAKSKKRFSNIVKSSHLVSPTVASRNKRKSSIIKALKKPKQPPIIKNGRAFVKPYSKHKTRSKDDSSEEGSYAQYRNQNGDFDEEKYRQSILKMLSVKVEQDAILQDKKKKLKPATESSKANFVVLPKIKNVYSSVKPRITSNFTKRKQRKVRKSKLDSELDSQDPSVISLRSKYWNDESLASRDPYFSVPSIDNF